MSTIVWNAREGWHDGQTATLTTDGHGRIHALPKGLTGFKPLPYGYRRWNGAVWADIQVDRYNAELARIERRHNDGYDVQHLVDGLYNLANGFDHA